MNKQERMKYVGHYEQYNNVYINFTLDKGRIFGLIEGVGKQTSIVTDKQLKEYETFINAAIGHYNDMIRFDPLAEKKVKKYKMYKKRLENVMRKMHEYKNTLSAMNDKERMIHIVGDGLTLYNGEVIRYDKADDIFLINDEEILMLGEVMEILESEKAI